MFSKSMEYPEELPNGSIEDIFQNINLAIYLTMYKPWKCTVLTSDYKHEEYKKQIIEYKMIDVRVLAGREAMNLIEKMFNQFESDR